MSDLGKTLRCVRLELGLTQEHFGALVGVKARSVSRWEKTKTRPPIGTRKALIDAVGSRNKTAAEKLAAAWSVTAVAPTPTPEPQAQPSEEARQKELLLTLLQASEKLDLPPRQLRGVLMRILRQAQLAGYSLETLVLMLEDRQPSEP
ncbi:MAG: helix-turn-helix transcriptional regulator [Polyangiaceae bacterium]